MSFFPTFIQHSFGSPRHGNQRRKINERNPNWKRRNNTVTVCRLHDTTLLKSKNATKTTRAH